MRMRCVASLALALAGATANGVGATTCTGDCAGAGGPSLEDLIVAVEIALERQPLDDCSAADADRDGAVTADEILRAVRFSFDACPAQTPPTNAAELLAWLQQRNYVDWQAESQVHASVGPHFGAVRTFLNDAVFASLEDASVAHPRGAALVKELYGSGAEVRGWSVMVKTEDDSGGGVGWYWYERYDSSTFASGNGVRLCFGCHGNPPYVGITSKDYVLTPFPLQ